MEEKRRRVDPRLHSIVALEEEQRAWEERLVRVLLGYLVVVVSLMASAPFVLVALSIQEQWFLPAAGGTLLALLTAPLLPRYVYRGRVERIRSSLNH